MTKRILTTVIAIAAAMLTALSALACQNPEPTPAPVPAATPTPEATATAAPSATATPTPEATAPSAPSAPAPETPTSAASVTGTVSYPGGGALPPGAELTVRLEDVSRADAPSVTIAERVIANPGQSPIRFEIGYDPADIDDRFDYAIQATITRGDTLLFINDMVYSVLTWGYPNSVDMVLVSVQP